MKLHRKQKSPTKIILLSTAALLLVGLGAYAFYAKQTDSWPFIPTSEDTKTRDADEVNYDPPTEQEIKDSQDAKQRGETEKTPEENTNNNQSTQSVVPVAISSASVIDNNLEIRAFTPGIIEGTGECTATISRGSKSVTSKSTAFVDTSSSICQPILIEKSRLESGTWQVVVTYSSPDAKGTSQTVTVTIQ